MAVDAFKLQSMGSFYLKISIRPWHGYWYNMFIFENATFKINYIMRLRIITYFLKDFSHFLYLAYTLPYNINCNRIN